MMIRDSGLLFWATLYMKLYLHRNAANEQKHDKAPKMQTKSDDDNSDSDDNDANKKKERKETNTKTKQITEFNTIEDHGKVRKHGEHCFFCGCHFVSFGFSVVKKSEFSSVIRLHATTSTLSGEALKNSTRSLSQYSQ